MLSVSRRRSSRDRRPEREAGPRARGTALAPAGSARGRLVGLLGLARGLASIEDERSLAERAADTVAWALGTDRPRVALRGDDGAYHVLAGPERASAARGRPIPEEAVHALRAAAGSGSGLRQIAVQDPVLARADLAPLLKAARTAGAGDPWSFVPILGPRGDVMGLVALGHRDPEALRQEELLLLEVVAELTAAGLEVYRLREMERSAAAVARAQRQQLERLLDASSQLRGRLAVEEVLTEIARAMSTAGGFGGVVIYLVEPGSDRLRVRATSGLTPDDTRRLRAQRVSLKEFAPLMRPEMRVSRSFLFDHRRFRMPAALLAKLSVPEQGHDRPADRWHPLDSLSVPLLDPGGATLGLISMDEPNDGKFPDRAHVRALEFFADQCALAVVQSRRYEAAHAEALTDELTGLANRRALSLAANRMVARARRRGDGLAVLFIDIDHFKEINDCLGHAAGDQVLREVADALRWRLRQADMVARYGGEEFVALVSAVDSAAAAALAEELRGLVAGLDPKQLGARPPLRVSIGVAVLGPKHSTPEALVAAADEAMYAAKRAGRDRVAMA
ncbi:MAG: diguanylate cyclase [Candidatus Dormibacteria bacterium]